MKKQNPMTFVAPFKLDADVFLTLYLAGYNPETDQLLVPDTRTAEGRTQLGAWLADPNIVCIEVGGSGQAKGLKNFDHHGPGAPEMSAAEQAAIVYGVEDEFVSSVVTRVNEIDLNGQASSTPTCKRGEAPFEEIVWGMLLILQDKKRSFEEVYGDFVSLIDQIKEKEVDVNQAGVNIWHFAGYQLRLVEEREEIENVVKNASFIETKAGRTLAFVITSFQGAMPALYKSEESPDIVIVFTYNFQGKGLTKASFGVNVGKGVEGVDLNLLYSELNNIETAEGTAGGRPTVGGSALGTTISLEKMVEIAIELY